MARSKKSRFVYEYARPMLTADAVERFFDVSTFRAEIEGGVYFLPKAGYAEDRDQTGE